MSLTPLPRASQLDMDVRQPVLWTIAQIRKTRTAGVMWFVRLKLRQQPVGVGPLRDTARTSQSMQNMLPALCAASFS
jgi:hypothetical protein